MQQELCHRLMDYNIIVWNVSIDNTKIWKSFSTKPFQSTFELGSEFHPTSIRDSEIELAFADLKYLWIFCKIWPAQSIERRSYR